MNTSQNYFYVQAKGEDGIKIVGHSTDKKTGEIYYKFLSRAKAKKLLADEKKCTPNLKYRIVNLKETFTLSEWE